MRVNASTGQYLGTASYSTELLWKQRHTKYSRRRCLQRERLHGSLLVLQNQQMERRVEHAGTQVQWVCKTSYNYQYPNYITGMDFDDNTGKMYIGVYDASAQNHYLKEVNPSSPTVITGTWLMTSTSYYYDHGAGLTVNMPNVMYNIYYMNTDYKSKHFHYTMSSGFSPQGERTMPGGGHYGMTDTDDHKVMFSCHWSSTNYCNQGTRKVHVYGDGAHYDQGVLLGVLANDRRSDDLDFPAINSINVNGIFGSVPAGTSVNVDVSNDGGVTGRLEAWVRK